MEPKIRFKGFEGEWKEANFKSFGHVAMCKRIFKYQTSPEGDIPFYKIGTFGSEPDAYISQSLFEEYKKKYSFPIKGDILISAAGTIGRTVEYNGENCYYQDSNIVWLAHNNNITNGFLKQLYSIVKWSSLEGATIKRLYNSNILETSFYIPQKSEQQAIASYFTSLDSQISASTSRLASLKQMKAASLQAMFPQEGETVPKIRFQNNRWQKYKVGDLCDLLTGYPFPGDKILTKGKDLLMRGINITEGSIRHSNEIDRYYNEDTIGLEKYRLQVGDLVIGMDGSKVGKNSALVTSKEKNSLLVQRVARLRNEDKNLIKLIQIAVGSDNFIKYVEEMKTSSAIPHISPADIRNFPLSLPEDSNERRLIASYFTSLDRQISLQSQRLEKLKQIKSACLDKMFV